MGCADIYGKHPQKQHIRNLAQRPAVGGEATLTVAIFGTFPTSSSQPHTKIEDFTNDFDSVYMYAFDHIQRKPAPCESALLGRTKGDILDKYSAVTKTLVDSRLLLLGELFD